MEWISIKDELPKRGKWVTVKHDDGVTEKAALIHNDWFYEKAKGNMSDAWKRANHIIEWLKK